MKKKAKVILTHSILDPKMQNVRDIVIKRMKAMRLTPYALAKRTNDAWPGLVTEQAVRNFVSGENDMKSAKLAGLLAVLGLEVRPKK